MLQNNDISIIVDNLAIKVDEVLLIDGLSFELYKNNTISIIGGIELFNQVICEIILGHFRDKQEIISGNVIINKESKFINILDFKDSEIQELRKKRVGILYKDSSSIFLDIEKIGKQMTDILLEKTNKNIKEIKDEIKTLMKYFDIPFKIFNKYPQHIKESRKNILAFILIIIMRPNFLLLNEPFHSDVITRNKMISLINRYKRDMATLILTSDILILSLEKFINKGIIIDNNKVILNDLPNNILLSDNQIIKQMIKEASFIF